ncbi:MAG: META domain-containing protein [Steroidobacteraceae bacterium]
MRGAALLAVTALGSLCACGAVTPVAPGTATVHGTAFYRERIALPPDAVFEARLEDVSRADAPAEVVASTRKDPAGSPPFAFTISYDPARLVASHRYAIRARVLAGDDVLFSSDTSTPLPAGDVPVEIRMVRAGAQTPRPVAAGAPAEPAPMRGLYRYLADAGTFADCASGTQWPVAQVQDNAALESAYLAARGAPGAPLLATLVGRIETREPMEGPPRPMLVVEQFIRVSGASCEHPDAPALEDTYWRLVALGDTPFRLAPGQRAPHFVLNSRDRRAAGHAGCNRMSGGYTTDGARLAFTQMASTMMACATGMDLERGFHEALARTALWRLTGSRLELTDDGGRVVAAFQAP